MPAPIRPSRTLMRAAKRRFAAPSVVLVYAYASSYHHSLRPCDARYRVTLDAPACSEGDR